MCMPSIAVADASGNVIVGVIRDPHRDETYAAMRGRGATMNGIVMRCCSSTNDDVSLGDAIIAMGSPPALESMGMSLRALPFLMPKVRTIRMLGSAALMLAWVANGRLTAYWEYDLRYDEFSTIYYHASNVRVDQYTRHFLDSSFTALSNVMSPLFFFTPNHANLSFSHENIIASSWDVAAGSILIEEAGGRMTDLEGERWNLRTRKICGSVGGTVHGEILSVLAEAGVV